MPIKYIQDSLFTTPDRVIAHGCNTQGVMGAGIAKIVKEKYPYAFEEYRRAVEEWIVFNADNRSMLGHVFPTAREAGNKIIFNCITQLGFGYGTHRYVSYDAVDNCMKNVAGLLTSLDESSISMPQIGSGLGGGNWQVIEAIIAYRLEKFNVNIYRLN
jgi:O-acetyl-ADP-ribose deacetylase (regulator of RNase III)